MEQIKELLERSCKYAVAQGAQQCDIIVRRNRALSLSAFQGKIDKYKVSSGQNVGVRVITKQQVGIAATSLLDATSLEETIDYALSNAHFSAPAPFQSIVPTAAEIISRDNFSRDDSSLESKIELAIKLEQGIRQRDAQAKTPYTGYSDQESEQFYSSSVGRFGYEQANYCTAHTSALLNREKQSGTFWASSLGHKLEELDIDYCLEQSFSVAQQLLQARACPTGKYTVIFDPDTLADLLQAFSTLFTAQSAMEGVNRFAQQRAEVVASSLLTIRDLPHYPDAFYQPAFDSEGVAPMAVDIIKEGIFNDFLHSNETANFYKTTTNGHAQRATQGKLQVAPTNLVVAAGECRDVWAGKVLKIIRLDGLHSGKNSISGDFSFGASGLLLQDGELDYAVKGITISGNFFQLLQQIETIGDKILANSERNIFAPEIRFADLDIAG